MGGGSKYKELSCCLARKARRPEQGRQRSNSRKTTRMRYRFFFFLKKKITNLGFQLLMGDSCWCSGFTEISLREARGWGGREEWRGATDRLRGSFAAEVKAELLGSWKWDRLKPRLLSCVYVLWVCLFSQGRPALHQHRSGLHEFFLLLKHGLN